MKQPSHFSGIVGAIAGALSTGLLGGCVVYQGQPDYGPGYGETAAPGEAYVVIQNDGDFYGPLGAYGQWEDIGSYGRCWVPGGVEAGWRPYSDGQWVSTDAGWYWSSPEPWGWATYHYGRWDFDLRAGWFWIPDTQWAPAWVSWREGHDYIGWAPLRPGERPDRGDFDRRRDEDAARGYVFVDQGRFLDPVRPTTSIRSSTTLISQTTNITNIQVVNKTVINEGPSAAFVERVSGRHVQPRDVRAVRHENERPAFSGSQRNRGVDNRNSRPPNAPPTAPVRPLPAQSAPVQPAPEPRPAHHPGPEYAPPAAPPHVAPSPEARSTPRPAGGAAAPVAAAPRAAEPGPQHDARQPSNPPPQPSVSPAPRPHPTRPDEGQAPHRPNTPPTANPPAPNPPPPAQATPAPGSHGQGANPNNSHPPAATQHDNKDAGHAEEKSAPGDDQQRRVREQQ